jgi:hypothetical protein
MMSCSLDNGQGWNGSVIIMRQGFNFVVLKLNGKLKVRLRLDLLQSFLRPAAMKRIYR